MSAEVRGFPRPPRFRGSRGRNYIPDVFVHNTGEAIEVKSYWAYRNAGPKLKAIAEGPNVRDLSLILCTGTLSGIDRVQAFLDSAGIRAVALNYKGHPAW